MTEYYRIQKITTSGSITKSEEFHLNNVPHSTLSGLGSDDHLQYIPTDGSRGFTGTISGVAPTEEEHLVTKGHLDAELATISGGGTNDHGELYGLEDDDHQQYVLIDGTRGFTATVSGKDPIQPYDLSTKYYIDNEIDTLSGTIPYNHDQLLGLEDDDHLQYVPVAGYRGFTSTVSGKNPEQTYHLSTKYYVDQEIDTLSGTIPYHHDQLLGLFDDDHYQYVPRDGSRGFTGTVSGIYPENPDDLTPREYVIGLLDGSINIPTPSGVFQQSLIQFHYDTSLGESSTNSTTFVNKIRLTASGVPEGNYRMGWAFEWRVSKQNAIFYQRLRLDGVEVLETYNASPFVDVTYWIPISNFYYYDDMPSGTHYIDLDYHIDSAASTAYIKQAKVEFWRIQ